MRIGVLLFLILMPLVFKGLEILLSEERDKYFSYWVWQIIGLFFYYGIEIIYVIMHHHITNEWVIFKGNSFSDAFPLFVICAIIYIIFSACFIMDCKWEDEFIAHDITNAIFLTVLFGVYLLIASSYINFNYEEENFNNTPYEITEQETIQLRAFSDTHTTTGNVRGGRFYINGEIRDNYELYYCFIAEDGSLTIRHFTYTEAHCKIFPEENCTNPRLEITTYGKTFGSKYDYYSDYVLYIPDDSIIGTGINME